MRTSKDTDKKYLFVCLFFFFAQALALTLQVRMQSRFQGIVVKPKPQQLK